MSQILNGYFAKMMHHSDQRFMAPFIDIQVLDGRWDGNQKSGPKIILNGVRALIDTGCEVTAFSDRLIERAKCPAIQQATILHVGVPMETMRYAGWISFPEISKIYQVQPLSRPIGIGEFNFDIVLGMDILRLYYFEMCRKKNIVRLTYEGELSIEGELPMKIVNPTS